MKHGGNKVDEEWLHRLFEICTCKCSIPENPLINNVRLVCSCEVVISHDIHTLKCLFQTNKIYLAHVIPYVDGKRKRSWSNTRWSFVEENISVGQAK